MATATTHPLRRRVVVTGMGAITPLGSTLEASWTALLDKKTGVTSLQEALSCQGLPQEELARELEAARALPSQVAAPVRSHVAEDSRTARFVQLALLAAEEAIGQAKLSRDWWQASPQRQERTGVCVGSGMSCVREIVRASKTVQDSGLRRLSPHFVPKVLSNGAAGRLSLEYGLRGPNHAASTACAAGAHAIGDALRCIQYDNADIMLAGGAESCIDPLSMAGFSRLRALSTHFNHAPHEASRPFDEQRDGFVMGEGAAILVLEELEHAKSRGVDNILAELSGYGLSGDAYHVTAPDVEGRGAELAMRMALRQANVETGSVDYVNAHATSTPKGDDIEARVVDRVLSSSSERGSSTRSNSRNKSHDRVLHVSSTKGATGHLLGAAGAAEAAFSILSLKHQAIPPTLNLHKTEEETGFRHVRDTIVVRDENHDNNNNMSLEVAISNSFGFGGTNACLVFQRLVDAN